MSSSNFEITPEQHERLAAIESKIVPGRTCGDCSLCCKVMGIAEIAKPPGPWCQHIRRGAGCAIYDGRPMSCRSYYCDWMMSRGLGPEWKPDKARFALYKTDNNNRLTAHVDPGYPTAWKREPYYRNFKDWALQGLLRRPQILIVDIMIGDKTTLVLPDRDVELGVIGPDEVMQFDHGAPGEVKAVRVVKRASLAAAVA